MYRAHTSIRCVLMSVVITSLIMSAGCSGFLTDTTPSSKNQTTSQKITGGSINNQTQTQQSNSIANITVPENGSNTYSGEVNEKGPYRNNTPYEPVQFEAQQDTQINITTQSQNGKPVIRLLNPAGQVINTAGGDSSTVRLNNLNLTETGQYTIEIAGEHREAQFKYNLTISNHHQSKNEIFAGPRSGWNKTERYLVFAQDYLDTAGSVTDYIEPESVSADGDDNYIIVSFQANHTSNLSKILNIDTPLKLTYTNLDAAYRNESLNFGDETWIPDRVYHRELTNGGELYRTSYLSVEWARDYARTNNSTRYQDRYSKTIRLGPAHPEYENEPEVQITEAEFPEEAYANFTVEDDD